MLRHCLHAIALLCFATLLASCATQSDYSTRVSPAATDLLVQAAQTSGAESQQYQILAVNQLLDDKNLNDAEQLLKKISRTPIDPTLNPQKLIVEAQLYLELNRPKTTISLLSRVENVGMLPMPLQFAYYTTKIQAYLRNNQAAESTLTRMSFDSLIQDDTQRLQNENIIWNFLQNSSIQQLNTLQFKTANATKKAWIQLALITKKYLNNTTELVKQLGNWQAENPGHPANAILPEQNQLAALMNDTPPTQVALLIPLHGPYAKMGEAIRDGFMTAFYQNAGKLKTNPSIKFYDTAQTDDINALYNQAIQEGADFVVGPLIKQNVNTMTDHSAPVTTLLLNYSDEHPLPNNFFEMGFSPQQAAIQAAKFAWQHNHQHILLIYPNDEKSIDTVDAFSKTWTTYGGKIAQRLILNTNQSLATTIQAAMNITQSDARAKQLQDELNEKLKATPRPRKDIDAIFLIAPSAEARQILPLLHFYYAGNIPVYAIATIYSGYPSPTSDHDLNGVYFDDMPFIISAAPGIIQLRNKILSLWKTNYQANNRLYALGIDAYTLTLLLPHLRILPNIGMQGVTGTLFLQDQTIYQQLGWARFVAGRPVEIN